jgi:hypothetical protein
MKKPLVLNATLNKIDRKEQNLYLNKKLRNAKPTVSINCPESFKFYKKTFGKIKKENLSNLI